MSKGSPRKAMAALLPFDLKTSGGTVKPMTLGMWAALERIGSPLVTGEDAKDSLELLPSLYLLTHDPREVFRGNLLDLAMQWADGVSVDAMQEILCACNRQMNAAFDVMPEIDPKKGTGAATTAGLPRSCTGRPQPTDGATTPSCGTSRCRPLSCSSATKRSTKKAK